MTDAPPSAGLVALADRIELWPVDRLRPYERNPRTHSDAQVDQIAASMVEFGWTNPVLVDEQGGRLWCGQARLLKEAYAQTHLESSAFSNRPASNHRHENQRYIGLDHVTGVLVEICIKVS